MMILNIQQNAIKKYAWIVWTFSIKNYDDIKFAFKLSLDNDVIGQDVL